MSIIQLKDLTFSYPDSITPVFSRLSLRIDTSWKLGLIGNNGRGKTTFLNLLSGSLQGEGQIWADIPFRRFPCAVSDPTKSACEIAEETAPDTQFWQLCREVRLLGLDEETLLRPFCTLSGGEQTKLLLAVLFAETGFPLLDEPTDHLDAEGRKLLADYLSKKGGFIVVSHDRDFLDGCCDHILSLNRTGTEIVQGNYTVWREQRDKKEQNERAEKEKLEKERSRLKESAARTAEWAKKAERQKFQSKGSRDLYAAIDRGYLGAAAARLQKRASTAVARIRRAENGVEELLKEFETEEPLVLSPVPFYKRELLRMDRVGISLGGKTLFSDLTLSLNEGDRVAVRGKNGCGKSTLLKLIAGESLPFSGERSVPPRLKISYVPQTETFLGTIADYAARYGIEESYLKAVLAKFGFDAADFPRDMRLFSAGQQKKAALARSLCTRANVYLWDEPLNYLDVAARERIEQAILRSNATIVFVEHDFRFVRNIATETLDL